LGEKKLPQKRDNKWKASGKKVENYREKSSFQMLLNNNINKIFKQQFFPFE
jgi:hypothetical protein